MNEVAEVNEGESANIQRYINDLKLINADNLIHIFKILFIYRYIRINKTNETYQLLINIF